MNEDQDSEKLFLFSFAYCDECLLSGFMVIAVLRMNGAINYIFT